MKSLMSQSKRLLGNSRNRTQTQSARRRFRDMRVETLEKRCLLTASIADWHLPVDPVGAEGELSDFNVANGPTQLGRSGSIYLPTQYRDSSPSGFLSDPMPGEPLALALDYLKDNADKLARRCGPGSLRRQRPVRDSGHGRDAYLFSSDAEWPGCRRCRHQRQRGTGRPDHQRGEHVLDRVYANPDRVIPGHPAATVPTSSLRTRFGYQLDTVPTVLKLEGGNSQKTVLSPSGIGHRQRQCGTGQYVPTQSGPQLAWKLNVPMLDHGRWLDASVSATDGQVFALRGLGVERIVQCLLSSHREPRGWSAASYAVDPQDPVASPFGWHDVNGLPGPDFFDTRGNNSDAVSGPQWGLLTTGNLPAGGHAVGGPNLNFNFPVDLTQQPSTYSSAAVTNLFYWVNISHDIHYRYGFDRSRRQFPIEQLLRSGLGGDCGTGHRPGGCD